MADTNAKYELTDETREVNGHTVHRIRALKDFGDVKAGELGGFVESENNLSQEGTAWIKDDAVVMERSGVVKNSLVFGDSVIAGETRILKDVALGSVTTEGRNTLVQFTSQNSYLKNVAVSSYLESEFKREASVYDSDVTDTKIEHGGIILDSRVDNTTVDGVKVSNSEIIDAETINEDVSEARIIADEREDNVPYKTKEDYVEMIPDADEIDFEDSNLDNDEFEDPEIDEVIDEEMDNIESSENSEDAKALDDELEKEDGEAQIDNEAENVKETFNEYEDAEIVVDNEKEELKAIDKMSIEELKDKKAKLTEEIQILRGEYVKQRNFAKAHGLKEEDVKACDDIIDDIIALTKERKAIIKEERAKEPKLKTVFNRVYQALIANTVARLASGKRFLTKTVTALSVANARFRATLNEKAYDIGFVFKKNAIDHKIENYMINLRTANRITKLANFLEKREKRRFNIKNAFKNVGRALLGKEQKLPEFESKSPAVQKFRKLADKYYNQADKSRTQAKELLNKYIKDKKAQKNVRKDLNMKTSSLDKRIDRAYAKVKLLSEEAVEEKASKDKVEEKTSKKTSKKTQTKTSKKTSAKTSKDEPSKDKTSKEEKTSKEKTSKEKVSKKESKTSNKESKQPKPTTKPESRTYIDVPFEQKDEAKGLGARWDATSELWYIPEQEDISKFDKWDVVPAEKVAKKSNSKSKAKADDKANDTKSTKKAKSSKKNSKKNDELER